jgi:hypothetical protein
MSEPDQVCFVAHFWCLPTGHRRLARLNDVGYQQITSNRAAVGASSAQVKDFAENPYIRKDCPRRVVAMTGSSSATKTRGTGFEDTYTRFD